MRGIDVIKVVVFVIMILSIITTTSANVTAERVYFSEDTAVPFETFVLMIGAGLVFLILAAITGFSYNGGLTMVFGLVSCAFLSVSAYASPVTGFYAYITNTTTNASSTTTPTVWLIFQPWMMWLMWGLAIISFFLFVFGILILFKERADREDQQWI